MYPFYGETIEEALQLPLPPAVLKFAPDALKFSSPNNPASTVGWFVEESVNEIVSGILPEVGIADKLAFGGNAATTGKIDIDSMAKRKRDTYNTLHCICHLFRYDKNNSR